MSFNIRDYVSDEHIESIGEIAKGQSRIIQALSLDNSQKDKEIERLNNIINEINSIVEYWGYDKEHNDISSFRMAMKKIKEVLGSDKEW